MLNLLVRSSRAKICLLAWMGILTIGWTLDGLAASRSVLKPLAMPAYGDRSPSGLYLRQLQDTVATNWYKEVVYYGYRSTISRGVVTAQYSLWPDGQIRSQQLLSNTANGPSGNAVLRAIRKSSMPPFPKEMMASIRGGLLVEQTFRYKVNDPTDYGLASSYPQLLVRRSPDIGAASNLDLRRYFDLSKFPFQSRIIRLGVLPKNVRPQR